MSYAQESASDRRPREPRSRLNSAMHQWQLPPLPGTFQTTGNRDAQTDLTIPALGKLARSRLGRANDSRARTQMEIRIIRWAYRTIRLNIKRGRFFEIDRVISEAQADCLGYARLFQFFGRTLGLDIGIIEVIIDNAGRPVPHVADIARLSDGRVRFIDLWYGSTDIHHLRMGLMVKQKGRWRIVDAYRRELRHLKHTKGLPSECVDAIAEYMVGNRHLERGIRLSDKAELREAILCYARAIARYPQNARFHFNRAVAYENLGDQDAARADYDVALRDEASLIRIRASQYEEVVRLMALDQIGLSARDEEICLLRKGFVTGKEVPPEQIAAKLRMSAREVNRITSRIESQIPEVVSSSTGLRISS
jgi:tetratricopeptide (TPR) repeat protein